MQILQYIKRVLIYLVALVRHENETVTGASGSFPGSGTLGWRFEFWTNLERRAVIEGDTWRSKNKQCYQYND